MPRKSQTGLVYKYTKKNVLDVAKSTIKANFHNTSASEKTNMYQAIEARVAQGKVHDYGRLIKQLEKSKFNYANGDKKTAHRAKQQTLKSLAGLKNWRVTKREFPKPRDEKEQINRLFSDYEEYYYDDEVNEILHSYLDMKKFSKSRKFKQLNTDEQKRFLRELEDQATELTNAGRAFKLGKFFTD